jgi:UDP-N-acetylmuramate-alanine ligase
MKWETAQHIYFIGIGGIGMSALARMMVEKGKKVSGSEASLTIQKTYRLTLIL